jgi:hypothetical protein
MTKALAVHLLWLAACGTALAWARGDDAQKDKATSAHQPRVAPQTSRGREWEIVFADEITVDEYARQMDYFKLEIAAVSKNGKIEYISGASQRRPEKRLGHRASDYRLHIGWKKGTLHAADRKLLAKAGISSRDKELWHFVPVELQAQLVTLEREYGRRDASQIQRTRFEVRPKTKAEGYEFVVVEQDPPKPAESNSQAQPP